MIACVVCSVSSLSMPLYIMPKDCINKQDSRSINIFRCSCIALGGKITEDPFLSLAAKMAQLISQWAKIEVGE